MKLKEAQMLGILALIAVGIILLCMWGGEDTPQRSAVDQSGAAETDETTTEDDLDTLYEDLLYGGDVTPAEPVDQQPETYVIEVGGQGLRASSSPSEEAVIRDVIEENQPEDILLDPVGAAEQEPAPEKEVARRPRPRSVTHVVQKGETLSAISKDYYGTSGKWRDILAANDGVLQNPTRLMPNMRLIIPDVSGGNVTADRGAERRPTLSTSGKNMRTHTVVKGDNLYRIARKYYGNGTKWREIRSANKHLISSPQDLKPGMVLRIP